MEHFVISRRAIEHHAEFTGVDVNGLEQGREETFLLAPGAFLPKVLELDHPDFDSSANLPRSRLTLYKGLKLLDFKGNGFLFFGKSSEFLTNQIEAAVGTLGAPVKFESFPDGIFQSGLFDFQNFQPVDVASNLLIRDFFEVHFDTFEVSVASKDDFHILQDVLLKAIGRHALYLALDWNSGELAVRIVSVNLALPVRRRSEKRSSAFRALQKWNMLPSDFPPKS